MSDFRKQSDSRYLCELGWQRGREEASVAKHIHQLWCTEQPDLAWAEPRPTTLNEGGRPGRLHGFTALVNNKQVSPWQSDLTLAEARLFWANKAIHIIADGEGCRWALFEEQQTDQGRVQAAISRVAGLQDRKRFGLPEAATHSSSLRVIEYFEQQRRIAWRLVTQHSVTQNPVTE